MSDEELEQLRLLGLQLEQNDYIPNAEERALLGRYIRIQRIIDNKQDSYIKSLIRKINELEKDASFYVELGRISKRVENLENKLKGV